MPTHEQLIKAGRITPEMNFHEKAWALTSRIPPGKVTTYGRIAAALGTQGARAVGHAMGCNPFAPAVPCHRVVGSDGSLTGFGGGLPKKQRMLREEGVAFVKGKVDLKVCLYEFEDDVALVSAQAEGVPTPRIGRAASAQ